MANTSGERDIERAKDLRRATKGVKSRTAVRVMEATAQRLEERGARKLAKVGRKRRKAVVVRG